MMPELFGTVFVASLLGSMHCIGMCGGFVTFYAGSATKASFLPHVAYNLGRLASYLVLGVGAGTVGAAVNFAGAGSGFHQMAAFVAGGLIIGWGLLLLLQGSGRWTLRAPRWLDDSLSKILPKMHGRPPAIRALVLGTASTFLPCGWLYGFAATAAGTGSAVMGMAVMATFWLGTLPAMLGVGLGMHRLARWVGPRLGVIMPIMLVILGTWTLMSRSEGLVSPPAAVEHHDCHS